MRGELKAHPLIIRAMLSLKNVVRLAVYAGLASFLVAKVAESLKKLNYKRVSTAYKQVQI